MTNPNDISEAFNDFFTKIGENIANKFDNQNDLRYNRYINTPDVNHLQLSIITPGEIINEINNLENKKANGHDNIPTRFLKLTANLICNSLSKIF